MAAAVFKEEVGVDEICQLHNIHERVIEISIGLKNLLSRQCHVESKMAVINKDMLKLDLLKGGVEKLHAQIAHTALLAKSVSAKVRRLDMARSNVSKCQQQTQDLTDLQLCSREVKFAIKSGNYEQAASHIRRFLSMDLLLLKKTADEVHGSENSIHTALTTLEDAAHEMRCIVVQKLDKAIDIDDLASVERFFKIFPSLGLHSAGIKKFSEYICAKLKIKILREVHAVIDQAKSLKKSQLIYADAVTVLLENYARVVEVNQPFVESYYGPGFLIEMQQILQKQCDSDMTHIIAGYNDRRRIHELQKQIDINVCNSARSGALEKNNNDNTYRTSSNKLDPKDVENTLLELTIMHCRIELYFRFIKKKISADIEAGAFKKEVIRKKMNLLKCVLNQSELRRQMQELLGIYLRFERYFMDETIKKAITLDKYEDNQNFSSIVDDAFFIVRKSIRRAFSCQSVNGAYAIISHAAGSLRHDFVNVIKNHLKLECCSNYLEVAQAYAFHKNSLQIRSNEERDLFLRNFLIYLNNADIGVENTETLFVSMAQEFSEYFSTTTSEDEQLIRSGLNEIICVSDILKSCVDCGLEGLRSVVIKPRVRLWVEEYLKYKHDMTEEEFHFYAAGNTFIQYLIMHMDTFNKKFKLTLTDRNYNSYMSVVSNELTAGLEEAIKKCKYNRLGAMALDMEIRLLGSYLSCATTWPVRDKMTRLSQITSILNLESVSELSEYWNQLSLSDTATWRLTEKEVRTILALRLDFTMEDIKRVRM